MPANIIYLPAAQRSCTLRGGKKYSSSNREAFWHLEQKPKICTSPDVSALFQKFQHRGAADTLEMRRTSASRPGFPVELRATRSVVGQHYLGGMSSGMGLCKRKDCLKLRIACGSPGTGRMLYFELQQILGYCTSKDPLNYPSIYVCKLDILAFLASQKSCQ